MENDTNNLEELLDTIESGIDVLSRNVEKVRKELIEFEKEVKVILAKYKEEK